MGEKENRLSQKIRQNLKRDIEGIEVYGKKATPIATKNQTKSEGGYIRCYRLDGRNAKPIVSKNETKS